MDLPVPSIPLHLPSIPNTTPPSITLDLAISPGLSSDLFSLPTVPFIGTTTTTDHSFSTLPPPDTTLAAPPDSASPATSTPVPLSEPPSEPTLLSTDQADPQITILTASPSATPEPTVAGLFITSTILTTVDGRATTIYSQVLVPTSLASSKAPKVPRRTVIIVASALGAVFILILALSIFFHQRRQQRRRLGLTEALAAHQKKQLSRAMFLHGEDLDDTSYRYPGYDPSEGYDDPSDAQSLSMRSIYSQTSAPHAPILLRPRGSETGSIFHEQVWPPPGESSRLVDPLFKASSQVDLSTIVDDVMGPAPPHVRWSSSFDYDESSSPPRSPSSPSYEPRHRSTASSFSGDAYEWPNYSQTRLRPSESSGSIVQMQQPRNSSPLARDSFDGNSDRSSFRDSRIWLDRAPAKRMSRLGQDSMTTPSP